VNGLYHVRAVNVGIAGEPGSIPFSPRADSVTDCIFNELPASAAVVQKVILDTLDGVLEKVDLGGRTFDLLKLDAEGAEYGIIKSIEPETIRRFSHIVMEFHQPPGDESPDAIYTKLAACGFKSREPRWVAGSPPQLRMFRRE
jgi:FkbM family methyltransferase